jgi:hypothetical protein
LIDERSQRRFGRRPESAGSGNELAKTVSESHTGDERRAGHRTRALLSGKIIVGNGVMSPDCVIRDLSDGGARVRISGSIELPEAVGLLVIKDGLLFDATLAWRRGDETGLAFTGRHDVRGDVDPAHRGVHRLWKELAPR